MQSPVIDALSRIPLTSKIRPINALPDVLAVRCNAVAAYLSMWIDGDELHREPPVSAMRYSRDRFRSLAFRCDVLGEKPAEAMMYRNVESTLSRNE